ncbi:hypothetical protein [Streptococcus bovimastitidis]|nr:hypothetical protein [Streptococcus bovimastitidis]
MIKSIHYMNILEIVKLFINDSFHGFIKRPIFKNKIGIYGLLTTFLILYCFYFYINAVEFVNLGQNRGNYTFEELKIAQKLSITSYSDLSFVFGILIFHLSEAIIQVKSSSLFTIKSLPYHKNELKYAVQFFKLGTSAIFFELFFIIMMPGLQIIGNVIISTLLFFTCHFSFFNGYMLSLFYYNSFNKIFISYYSKLKNFLTVAFLCLTFYFFYIGRFKLETFLSKLINQPIYLTIICFVFNIIIVFIFLSIPYRNIENQFLKSTYYYLPFSRYLPNEYKGLMRTKLYIVSQIVLTVTCLYSLIVADFMTMLSIFGQLFPFLNVVFLHYFDSTAKVRKIYNLLNVSILKELFKVSICVVVFQIPLIILGFYLPGRYHDFLWGILLAFAAIIIGALFPKSSSTLNETVSTFLLFLTVVMILIMKNYLLPMIFVIVIFIAIILYLLKKERSLV